MDSNDLAAALDDLDVKFLRSQPHPAGVTIEPEALLAALAASKEARLRLALIPLLLRHPEYAACVRSAADQLSGTPKIVLMCYYTAAYYLQQRATHRKVETNTPESELPDLFSQELCLAPASNSEDGLRELAARQKTLSGRDLNWLGTYEHGARRWRIYSGS